MLPSLARTVFRDSLLTSSRLLTTRGTSTRHYSMAEPEPTTEQVVAQLKQVQSDIELLRVKHNLTKPVMILVKY